MLARIAHAAGLLGANGSCRRRPVTPRELVDCGLRDYVARHGYSIASRDDLVDSMQPYVALGRRLPPSG